MKPLASENIDIGRNITINESGAELLVKDVRYNPLNPDSDKSDPDEYPFEAITYGEGGSLFGLPYSDHNYAIDPDKATKSKTEKNSNQLSLLAKLALAKHDPKNDLSPAKNSESFDPKLQLLKCNDSRIKNVQLGGNKAILLAPNKSSLFSRQKNGIFMKPQLSLNSPANLLKNDFIRCICGYTHDDGLLVKCDKCMMHQHIDCVSPNNDGFVPTPYFCDICQPRQMRYAEAVCLQREKLAFINSGGTTTSLLNNVTGGALRYRTGAPTFLPSRLFVTTSNNKSSPVQLRISSGPGLTKTTNQSPIQIQSNMTNDLKRKTGQTKTFQPISAASVGQTGNLVYPDYISLNNFTNASVHSSLNQQFNSAFKSKRKQDLIFTTQKAKPELGKDNGDANRYSPDENIPPSINPSVLGLCEDSFKNLTNSQISDRLTQHFSSRTKSNQTLIQHYFNLLNTSQRNTGLQTLLKLSNPPAYQLVMLEFNQKSMISIKFIESHEPILEAKGVIRLAEEYTESYDFRKHFEPYVFFYNKFHKTSLLIDSRESGNSARFLRRSCIPNCEMKHILYQDIETGDLMLKFVVFSIKPIHSKVELTIPFDFDPSQCRYNVKCACDRPNCKILTKSSLPNNQGEMDEGQEVSGEENESLYSKDFSTGPEDVNSPNYRMRDRNSIRLEKKPGRKPSGISRGRTATGRVKKTLRKPRGASKLLTLGTTGLKNVAKTKKSFSIRNSLIRRANATLSIAASRKSSAEKNGLIEKHINRRSSGLIGRPPLKRSRIHSIRGRASVTSRSRSSIKRVNYNFDQSSSSSGIDEEKISIKKEDENFSDTLDAKYEENSAFPNDGLEMETDDEDYEGLVKPRIKPETDDYKVSENEENTPRKSNPTKRRESAEKRRSAKRQSNLSRLNSSGDSTDRRTSSGQRQTSQKKNQTPEKSREDKWMDEVMRRIERMEKKDRRRKNSGQQSAKSQSEDCKSPDNTSQNNCLSPEPVNSDHNPAEYQGYESMRDCNLIVYKTQDKDPMAKFSRSRSSTMSKNDQIPQNSLAAMASLANDELSNLNNPLLNLSSQAAMVNDSQPTKKRWLTQARLEKEEDDAQKNSENAMDKLLALSMTASEILMNTNRDNSPSHASSSPANSYTDTPAIVHPIKKRIIISQESQKKEENEEEMTTDLHLLSNALALNESITNVPKKEEEPKPELEPEQAKSNLSDDKGAEAEPIVFQEEPEPTPPPQEVDTTKIESDQVNAVDVAVNDKEQVKAAPIVSKKTKMSLSEYRRRKGIPETPDNGISRKRTSESNDVPGNELNVQLTVQDESIENKITELLNRSQQKLPEVIRSRFNNRTKDILKDIDCQLEKSVKEGVLEDTPPPPPPLINSSLIDCTSQLSSNNSNKSTIPSPLASTVASGGGTNNTTTTSTTLLNYANNNNIDVLEYPEKRRRTSSFTEQSSDYNDVNFLVERDLKIRAWQENHSNRVMMQKQPGYLHQKPGEDQKGNRNHRDDLSNCARPSSSLMDNR